MNKELLQERFARKSHLQEIIQDLIIRFIICCPEEEHESFERLFFQIEEAHWFYMDEYRQKNPKLPSLNFKQFAEIIFASCPLLQPYKDLVQKYRTDWVQYKTSVPVCGAIILNKNMNRALLVRGIGSNSSWSFPRGKINKDEPTASCAIREVLEETGLDISNLIKETEFLEMTFNEQKVKLYVVVMNVLENELPPFAPRTRGEIGAIEWLHLDEDILGNGSDKKKRKFFCVIPFVRQLKPWINKQRVITPTKSSPRQLKNSPKNSPRERPPKNSGKNNMKRIIMDDYQIPTRRILKRGESLGNVQPVAYVSSSYSPPSSLGSAQAFAYSSQQVEMRTMHAPSDSFLNFHFNADEIVGDLAFVV